MGLMDKFKNFFKDEEIIEDDEEETVEIKEVKKKEEPKLPTFMREKIKEEEQESEENPTIMQLEPSFEIKREIKLEKNISEEPLMTNENESRQSFKFPIEFNEDDFTETRSSRQSLRAKERANLEEKEIITSQVEEKMKQKLAEQKKELKVSEIYKDKKVEKEKDEKRFRATPIISPIYGVLDKNYVPDEVEKASGHNLEESRPSKSVDFDSVRKKAYGSISEEIKENLMCENCEYLKEAKECKAKGKKTKAKNKSGDYELKEECYKNKKNNYEDITIDKATENYYDYGVEYEKKPNNPYEADELENYYLDEDEENTVQITDYTKEDPQPRKNEIPPVKSSINLLSTLKKSMGEEDEEKNEKNLELTDDLFNLIDSMYDERNDNK